MSDDIDKAVASYIAYGFVRHMLKYTLPSEVTMKWDLRQFSVHRDLMININILKILFSLKTKKAIYHNFSEFSQIREIIVIGFDVLVGVSRFNLLRFKILVKKISLHESN